jgi:hypothetical protein
VTRFGTIRLRIARTRGESFLPVGLRRFQRRAEEVSLLIREAFLRGISMRQVGRVVATLTGETVSAQTVSKLTRDLDEAAVRPFHQMRHITRLWQIGRFLGIGGMIAFNCGISSPSADRAKARRVSGDAENGESLSRKHHGIPPIVR